MSSNSRSDVRLSRWAEASPAKRAFDVTFALAGLLIAAPVMLVAAVAIKLEDRGPIFFRQERIGRSGRTFRIWKLRTMRAGDASRLITTATDSRITRTGNILRSTKVDELPQLFNVLAGDMSIVGPRPEVPRYVDQYNEQQRAILRVRPGVTDPASLAYSNEAELLNGHNPEATYFNEIMPDKIRRSLDYAQKASFKTDALVIWRTISAVWLPRGSSTFNQVVS
jgi:lipopolysaccharide/colanic/teichoic acid biosynthesis glycosyltransferase